MRTKTLAMAYLAKKKRIERQNHIDQIISSSIDENYYEEWFEFDELDFDIEQSKLNFVIKKWTQQPKITRYITRNYEKTPIYGDFKTKSKVYKKFNKIINVEKFLNIEVLNMDIEKELILQLIEEIGFVPHWRDKEIRIEEINEKILQKLNSLRTYNFEKKNYTFQKIYLKEEPSNLYLISFFALFTFGLSFYGFVSKKQSKINKKINTNIEQQNAEHKSKIDLINEEIKKEIDIFNSKINTEIESLKEEINSIQSENYSPPKEKDGWELVKEASYYNFSDLKNKKGVYTIKNLSKNIYYVGQSKDLSKRLNQHFSNGDVRNIKFAKDWYEGDVFGFKYIILNTKDELDSKEKELIDYYDSFNNGYNNTSGNT